MIYPSFLRVLYRKLRPTIVNGKNNTVAIKSKRHDFRVRIDGNNNSIEIGEGSRLKNTRILLYGDNNRIIAEDGSKFDGPCNITLEGNATLYIGRNSGIRGVTFILKDANITVGRNCMFSYNVLVRNNDSHKVLDSEGNVTNEAKDIVINDHVWLCERSSILKGVTIGADSIIAFGAVVTKDCPPNSIMAGNPARVVKQNINWLNK
jgi:acetyltransferase-like isoleucine patch superfamily enzyme